MPPPSPQNNNRTTWRIIFFALVFSVGFYGLMGFFIGQGTKSRPVSPILLTLRPYVVVAGALALAAAVTWLRFKIDGKIGGGGREVSLSAGEFQTHSIVALALSEMCCIFGLLLFFLGAPLAEFGLYALGTLLIDFAFILPRGLQFWAASE